MTMEDVRPEHGFLGLSDKREQGSEKELGGDHHGEWSKSGTLECESETCVLHERQ